MRKLFKNKLLKIGIGLALFVAGIIFKELGFGDLSVSVLAVALLLSGSSVFISALRGILRLDFLDEKFLMSVASIGAFIIGESVEGVAVMLFYLVGEYFEYKAIRHSRNSIKELMDICPDTVTVLNGDTETDCDAEDVEIGETVIIRSGERVALDCVITEGTASVDTSALTGEHLPKEVSVGDTLDSGVIVVGGALVCRVIHRQEDSCAARIIELVENATEKKSREEAFITKFSRYYTPAVTVLALIMASIPPIFGWLELSEAIYRALSFLVISCPCAIVISVPMAFFGGIGGSASRGILFKGGNTFSPMSKIDTAIFDKTGTLTSGKLKVLSVNTVGISKDELLFLAASCEYPSMHPIAEAIKECAPEAKGAAECRELTGLGVVGTVYGDRVAVGNKRLLLSLGIDPPRENTSVGTVYVARNNEYLGSITLGDTVKPEAVGAIEKLRHLGARRIVILSGDEGESVERVAREVGIEEFHSSLMPDDKYKKLEEYISTTRGSTVYIGDGINDAPCLARADVGIAMGALGSDSAIEASDAVIMSDNLSRVADAVKIARKTLRIAKQNIVFSIGIKLLVLILVSVNLSGMWMAVFADVGVAVIAILNSMRALRFKGVN